MRTNLSCHEWMLILRNLNLLHKKTTDLYTLEAIHAGDTVTNGQNATQVDNRRLIRLLPLLDGRAAIESMSNIIRNNQR